jgi:hypothetical protein
MPASRIPCVNDRANELTAIANYLAKTPVDIDHRRKTKINTDFKQFHCHNPCRFVCKASGRCRINIELLSEPTQWRQLSKSIGETLNAPTLLIHRN